MINKIQNSPNFGTLYIPKIHKQGTGTIIDSFCKTADDKKELLDVLKRIDQESKKRKMDLRLICMPTDLDRFDNSISIRPIDNSLGEKAHWNYSGAGVFKERGFNNFEDLYTEVVEKMDGWKKQLGSKVQLKYRHQYIKATERNINNLGGSPTDTIIVSA